MVVSYMFVLEDIIGVILKVGFFWGLGIFIGVIMGYVVSCKFRFIILFVEIVFIKCVVIVKRNVYGFVVFVIVCLVFILYNVLFVLLLGFGVVMWVIWFMDWFEIKVNILVVLFFFLFCLFYILVW